MPVPAGDSDPEHAQQKRAQVCKPQLMLVRGGMNRHLDSVAALSIGQRCAAGASRPLSSTIREKVPSRANSHVCGGSRPLMPLIGATGSHQHGQASLQTFHHGRLCAAQLPAAATAGNPRQDALEVARIRALQSMDGKNCWRDNVLFERL